MTQTATLIADASTDDGGAYKISVDYESCLSYVCTFDSDGGETELGLEPQEVLALAARLLVGLGTIHKGEHEEVCDAWAIHYGASLAATANEMLRVAAGADAPDMAALTEDLDDDLDDEDDES
jgi:hypothetical protein